MKENKNAVIFIHAESDEKDICKALRIREIRCLGYAKKNGYTINKVFVEIGKARLINRRPTLQGALRYCEKNKIEVVITPDKETVSSLHSECEIIIKILESYSTKCAVLS